MRLTLLLLAGLPGTGKTTLAAGLSRALGWPAMDKDTLVSTLLDGGVSEPLAHPCAYNLLIALARDLLVEQRLSVIVDSPAIQPAFTDRMADLARLAGAELKVVLCLADQDLRNRRVAMRQGLRSQPVGVSRTPDDGRSRFAHLPADTLLLRSDQPLADLVTAAVASMQADPNSGR